MKTRSRAQPLLAFVERFGDVVPYVHQSFSWDCGLACVEMALRSRGISAGVDELHKLCATDSVWSIDISYLLHHYGLHQVYLTTTKGVRAEYGGQEFYRLQLRVDTERVNQLFNRAEAEGIHVVQRTVDMAEIVHEVEHKKSLVLVLVDKRLLKCGLCDDSTETGLVGRTRCGTTQAPGFLGHYILLYAYDKDLDAFLMKDPAANSRTCVVPGAVLERARKAFGTDEDIIFVGRRVSANDAAATQA